jgi:hypothetical protein
MQCSVFDKKRIVVSSPSEANYLILLQELGLVPASLLNFSWSLDIEEGRVKVVRYHSGGSMKLNACILLLTHMVYV